MKRLLVFCCIIFAFVNYTSAQNKVKYEMAKNYYDRLAYSDAIKLLEEYLIKSDDITGKQLLADCYFKTNQYDKAEAWLTKVVNDPKNKDKHYQLYLAQILQINQKYDDAAKWYGSFVKAFPLNVMALNQLKACKNYKTYFGDSLVYLTEHLGFNTDGYDFGACIQKDKFIFTSTGGKVPKDAKKEVKLDAYTDEPFMDIYETTFDDSAYNFTAATKFELGINTKYHEGPLTFNPNGKEVFFTRNDYNPNKGIKKLGFDDSRIVNLKIYKGFLEDGKWVKEVELPFNSSEYSCGHPTIDFNTKTMYFVSDMPGGFGGTDIWYSVYNGMNWSIPENLGPKINTEGNEMYPFLAKDGTLYFASNGHPGLGGLDIFSATLYHNDISNVKNLNAPINSSYDDFGFLLNDAKKIGFISSNKPGGVGEDDIYLIYRNTYTLDGKIINRVTKEPIQNAEVVLNQNDIPIQNFITDASGGFNTILKGTMNYTFKADAKNFIPESATIRVEPSKQDKKYNITIELSPIIAEITYIDANSKQIIPAAFSTVTACTEANNTSLISNENGIAYLNVVENCNYKLLSNAKGYFPLHSTIEVGVLNDTLRKIIELEPINNAIMSLKNIYYDFNKCFIRPDAIEDLNMLFSFMKMNPDAQVELSSHTDSRGKDDYNLKLSQCRADAAVQWLLKKGILKSQITAVGYGESKLLNGCTNDVTCSEEQHQLNRRTEFRVTNAGVITSSKIKENVYTDRCKNCPF